MKQKHYVVTHDQIPDLHGAASVMIMAHVGRKGVAAWLRAARSDNRRVTRNPERTEYRIHPHISIKAVG